RGRAPSAAPSPPRHARPPEMPAALGTLGRGGELCAAAGKTLEAGTPISQPGLVQLLEALSEEGAASAYRGSLAEALLAVDGVVFTADDLAGYRPQWRDPVLVAYEGRRVATRGGLSGIPELLPRLPHLSGLTDADRVLALVAALASTETGAEHTTNTAAVDGHGRACVLTHSLGVGAGVWVPGFDTQLNNLLGEG